MPMRASTRQITVDRCIKAMVPFMVAVYSVLRAVPRSTTLSSRPTRVVRLFWMVSW